MPDVAVRENSLFPANLCRPAAVPALGRTISFANTRGLGLASALRFDLHRIKLPPLREAPLGPVYASEEEMRYGPRPVDEAGLERIRSTVAERSAPPAPAVPLQ